ncbi:hypothetical protein O181_085472 [Austropuccinia psidii MF-1]|uniref:Uncharacterized protein n=1 Tax=Austropuccinia psidii MF-1 TaxID=1389203 RepID=A0A9Q3ILQ5_9BASI|nr:hypothetical protein [Austropuccinia psidii MF-1]
MLDLLIWGVLSGYSPVPSLPHKQTAWKPTPGPSGTQWLENLFHKPSRTDEPPISGLSPSSEPYEDISTCEPELEVAPKQSMEECFTPPTPPHSVIIINDTPIGSPPSPCVPSPSTPTPSSFPRVPSHCPQEPNCLLPSFPQ